MKFLVDQNLPPRSARMLNEHFPGTVQSRRVMERMVTIIAFIQDPEGSLLVISL